MTNSAGHIVLSVSAELLRRYKIVYELGIDPPLRSQYMEFGRAECMAIFQRRNYRHLAIFHTRRDFREKHVALSKMPVAFLHVLKASCQTDVNSACAGSYGRHGYE